MILSYVWGVIFMRKRNINEFGLTAEEWESLSHNLKVAFQKKKRENSKRVNKIVELKSEVNERCDECVVELDEISR